MRFVLKSGNSLNPVFKVQIGSSNIGGLKRLFTVNVTNNVTVGRRLCYLHTFSFFCENENVFVLVQIHVFCIFHYPEKGSHPITVRNFIFKNEILQGTSTRTKKAQK